jgi:antitoxin component YwqK of YwqJK toxin-antitoxin module
VLFFLVGVSKSEGMETVIRTENGVTMVYKYDYIGKLQSITPYVQGVIHGIQFFYDRRGHRIKEVEWVRGEISATRNYDEFGHIVPSMSSFTRY